MSKNTNIAELINYVSIDGSGNVVATTGIKKSGGTSSQFLKADGSVDASTYATQTYVTTAVSNLVASAPSTLDTLNELATALGNDANFATTIATSIGTKQAQLNGTGFVKISGTTISYDNSTYLTTSSASSTYLPLSGGTLTGQLSGTSIRLSSDIQATDYRFSGTGYISYDVNNSGTESLVIRKYGTSVLTFNSLGAATFSNSITSAGLNLTSGGVININTQNGFQIGADSASGGFYVYDNTNAVYRLKISNAGVTVLSGALTIGGALSTSSPIYSSSGTPLTFTANGNSDTYTQTTIYANQNNTSGDTANGIFIERGRLSNSGSAEVRNFIIGARGGSIQWRLDSAGNGTYSGSVNASTSITAGTTVTAGTRLQAPSLTIGYWDGATNRFESSTRPMLFTSYGQDISMGFDGGGGSLFLKYSNGFVGFGQNSPQHRIHASGNIYSTDTIYGRNIQPFGFAGPAAGSPTSAGIPAGYSTMTISSPCDNQWRVLMNNINDTKAFFWVTLGDAASKDTANYFMSFTSPAYGVSNFGNITYQDNGWNTGGFEFTYDSGGSGTYRLLVRCTSYYNSANTAYGTIYFLRLE